MAMLEIGDPLLVRGDLVEDARYGQTEILAVTEKKVWYKNHKGVWHTSKDEAFRRFTEGTAFPPLEDSQTPRWELPYV